MRVQQVNNCSQNYNPNFSAIKSVQYNGLFNGLTHRRMGEYRKIIESSLREIPEFMNYCNNHDVDIIFDSVKSGTDKAKTGYNINIILKIVYEKLRNGENINVNDALRKIFSPIEQKIVVEHEFEQEGSSLSYKVINNFVKNFNKDERNSFIDKIKDANLAILNATAPELYKKSPKPATLIFNTKPNPKNGNTTLQLTKATELKIENRKRIIEN